MEVLVKLYNMVEQAADGSTISRQVTEEYLASDAYKQMMDSQLALGGVTHKDREVADQYSKLVGPDDQVLINQNATHYIKKIYTTPDNDYAMAIIKILDPKDYAGERKANIMNLIADLKAGIKLPCSVVIQALWSVNNNCEKIINVKGVDMTMNPSFSGSGVVKVYSSVIDTPEVDSKAFSTTQHNLEGCTMRTIVFSTTAEVISNESKKYSLEDIAKKFGRTSPAFLEAKKHLSGGFITEELLDKVLNADGSSEDENFEEDVQKEFSTVNSVRDRMYFSRYPRIVLINRLLKSYKNYYDDKKEVITDEQFKWLQRLLIQDIFMLMKNVSDKLVSGNNLSALYALQQFGTEVKDAGMELSKVYRQILVSEKVLGFIPEGKYAKWKDAYSKFLIAIMKYCFNKECEIPLNSISQI